MIITSQGQTIKLSAGMIPIQSRSATGVRVVDIGRPDFVVGVDRTADDDEEEARKEAEEASGEESDGADGEE